MKLLYLFLLGFCAHMLTAQNQDRIIFQDDFYEAKSSRKNLRCVHGSYVLKNGEVVLNGERHGAKLDIRNLELDKDYEISCRIKVLPPYKGGHGGFRIAQQGKKFIYVHITGSGRYVGISGCGKTVYKGLKVDPKVWNDLKVVCRNNTLTVFANGKECAKINDVSSVKGGVSFYCYKLNMAYDDLCIKKADIQKGEVKENLVNNSSFEYSTAPNIPDCWGISGWGLAEDEWIGKMDELWSQWRRDTVNPYHGKFCMRVGGYKRLGSTFFNPSEGKVYTFSVWMRGSSDNTKVGLIFSNWGKKSFKKDVAVGRKWQRVVWTLPAVQSNQCGISFVVKGDNVLWVDAVQLVSGEKPLAYMQDSFNGDGKKQRKQVPSVSPVKTTVAPVFDGTLKDPVWKKAAKMKFVTVNGDSVKEKTETYLLYDKKNIYIGFRCYDSQMSKVRAKVTKRDGHVWNDDSVELFIGPSGPRGDWADYYHLGVSITGAKYDAQKENQGWNREWQAKTKRFADRWETEIILPFKMFDLNKFNQGDWTFNVCRENGKIREYSCWSPTFGSFHKTDNFGILKAFPKNITGQWIKNNFSEKGATNNFITAPMKVDGKPFIGYGLAWQSVYIPGENTFKQMKAAGMNLINWNVRLKYVPKEKVEKVLELAHKYGIKVVWWVSYTKVPMEMQARVNTIKHIVNTYKKFPAIIAWMVFDEPHSHADIVKECLKTARTLDPSRPAFINLTPHGLGIRLGGLPGDALCIDQYPIFFNGSVIADVDKLLVQAQQELKGSPRPLWMFLQGMSNALWVWRGPTPAEFTAQTYVALVNGVTGIMYFTGVILPVDTWKRAGTLSKEIKKLTPVLLCNDFAKVSCGNTRIKFMARKLNGKIYILAINPYNKQLSTDFVLPGKIGSGKRIFETGAFKVKNNRISAKFMPYERQCYEVEL